MNKLSNIYEAVYHDDEESSYRGGWEVVKWDTIGALGTKCGKSVAKFYNNEAACIAEAARLNSLV